MSKMAGKSALGRIEALVDENSFVQIGGLINARNTDFNMQDKETPADGVITGYGLVAGSMVFVYSQDASVLNGTIGEMHAKKITRLYDMAMKMGSPVIGFIDCAGIRLQEATDALNAFGEIYGKMAMASGVIPQITAVFGNCGGGLSILSEMSDFTFMAEDGRLFVNAPNTLAGNREDKCDTASADYQAAVTGLADMKGSEEEVIGAVRTLVSMLPQNCDCEPAYIDCTDDLNRVCEGIENCTEDTLIAIGRIADNGIVAEMKSSYAKDMVTAFIRLDGSTVGVVANRSKAYDEEGNAEELSAGVLTSAGCMKAAEFVDFCDAFNIPVVTLTNVRGFKATVCEEKTIARAAAKLTYAFANATVAKVNVVVGDCFGSAFSVMNAKSTGCDVVFAWPTAHIGTMNAENAVRIIYDEELKNVEDKSAFLKEKAAEYETLQTSAVSAAKRGYVDSIIEPCDTRKYIIGALDMLYSKREEKPSKKHGTV